MPIDKVRHCTSHTPSMQTFVSVLEQGVPSLTLLDMAKKKSKSSAMQYSLQMSSSAQRTHRKTTVFKETCCLKWRGVHALQGFSSRQVERRSICSDAAPICCGKEIWAGKHTHTQRHSEQSCCFSMSGRGSQAEGNQTQNHQKRTQMIRNDDSSAGLFSPAAVTAPHQSQQHRLTVCTVSVGLKWKRQELTKKAPLGVLAGLQVYFVFQISYRRQVTTAVFD